MCENNHCLKSSLACSTNTMRSRTRQNLPKEIKHRGSREFVLIPITNRIKLLECIQWLLCRLSFKMAFTPFAKLKKTTRTWGRGLWEYMPSLRLYSTSCKSVKQTKFNYFKTIRLSAHNLIFPNFMIGIS